MDICEVRLAVGDGGRKTKTNQRKARMGDNITHFVNRCQMPGRSCWWAIPTPTAIMTNVNGSDIVEGVMTVCRDNYGHPVPGGSSGRIVVQKEVCVARL
mmetsp:Transcript_18399/g.39790  ORF Transcript_18399/g.39790 Transcript_18399/m.39790 type:complete len:99 (-) Transcript_18399:66-362(-)